MTTNETGAVATIDGDPVEVDRTATDDALAVLAAPAATLSELERMTARHETERRAMLDRLAEAERTRDRALVDAVRGDVAETLRAALDEVRASLRADAAGAGLYAHPVYGEPREAKALAEVAEQAGPGERPVLLMIPREDAFRHAEKRAWALVDVADVVFGRGR